MIVDIIIIAILALSIFLGYKKGLIELSVKLVAVIIALVATLILFRPISSIIINTTTIDEKIQQAILDKSDKILKNEQSTQTETSNGLISEVRNEILPETAKELSYNIIRAIVIILLYIIIKIALKFVTALADLIAKLPILDQFNKLGGIIYGILRGILIIYVVLLLISFFGQVNPQNAVHKEIESSFIGKQMYNNNIINLLIQ